MEEKLIHKELLRLVRSALWHNEELPVSYDEELLSPVFGLRGNRPCRHS